MADVRVIARWFAEDQLEGRRRSVTVGPDQVAVVVRDGAYGEPQSERRVETRGRFGGGSDDVEVLVANLAPFTVEYELDEIAGALGALRSGIPIVTRDNKAVSGSVRLTLAVNPDRPDLLSQLRQGRLSISDGDVSDALRDEFLTQVIRTTVAEIESSELRGTSEQFRSFYRETQAQLESQLANYGLSLQNFAIHVLPSEAAAEAERQQIERRRQLEQASQEFGVPRRQETTPRPASSPPPTQPSIAALSTGGGKGKWILVGAILVVAAAITAVLSGTLRSGGGDVALVVAATSTVVPTPTRTPSPTSQPRSSATQAGISAVPTPTPTPTSTPEPAVTLLPTATQAPTSTTAQAATVQPVATLTPIPTSTPMPVPTSTPIFIPTASPTPVPTSTPVPSVVQLAWLNTDSIAISSAVEGAELWLFAQLDGVPDSTLTISIYEVDIGGLSELVATGEMAVTGGIGWSAWTAYWQKDQLPGLGDPEYKFVVLGVDSPELDVTRIPFDLAVATLSPGTSPTQNRFPTFSFQVTSTRPLDEPPSVLLKVEVNADGTYAFQQFLPATGSGQSWDYTYTFASALPLDQQVFVSNNLEVDIRWQVTVVGGNAGSAVEKISDISALRIDQRIPSMIHGWVAGTQANSTGSTGTAIGIQWDGELKPVSLSPSDFQLVTLDGFVGYTPVELIVDSDDGSIIQLLFDRIITDGGRWYVRIVNGVQDLAGNSTDAGSVTVMSAQVTP